MVINPNSERNLISICLKNSDSLYDIEGKEVYPEHFGIDGHRYVYSAMLYLKSKDTKPTPMAIMEVLSGKTKEAVEDLGGLEYLMLLEETNVPINNLGIFTEKVKQSYTRRMLYRISDSVGKFVLSDEAEVLNPSELIHHAESQINDLAVNTSNDDNVYKMGDDTEEVLNQRAESPSTVPGLEVGWDEYDKITNGAQGGDLIVVVAPSKTGKSVLLTNWAKNISIPKRVEIDSETRAYYVPKDMEGQPVLYIDTEMNSREQEDRILSNITGIPHDEIVSGMYVMDTHNGNASEKIELLKEARAKLNLGNYYHIYMPQFTIEKVMAITRKFQMQFGIVALFFDYIKIPANQANFRDAQEYQKLGFFTSGLKDLAGILNIPVFSAAQANRNNAGENTDPSESDIGGSYRILQLASKLMFLYNKSDEQIARDGIGAGNQQLFIKFQRNGQSDCPPINIMFNKPILRQVEASAI